MLSRNIKAKKRLAIVAHDNRKAELMEWAHDNRSMLARHELYGTGTTGKMLQDALDLPVIRLLSGPLGGDQQIGAMIAEERVDMLIFFWDPMAAQPHDPDIKALLRLGVVWNIPMACNRATADFMLSSPFMAEDYEARQTDYSTYIKRNV